MKKERIIEELARLDGNTKEFISIEYIEDANWHIGTEADGYKTVLDDYLEDHNAIQRIVDGLDGNQTKRFIKCLCNVVGVGLGLLSFDEVGELAKAECPQKCIALLKAMGRHEDE